MNDPTNHEQLLRLNQYTFAAEAKEKIGDQDWDQYLWRVLADDFRLKRSNSALLPQDKRQMITHIQYDQDRAKREPIGEPTIFWDGDFGFVLSIVTLPNRPHPFHNLKVFTKNPTGEWQCVYWQVRELAQTPDRLSEPKGLEEGSHSRAAKYMRVPATLDTRGDSYPLPIFSTAAPDWLAGKRILIISADGPELPEIDVPMTYLQERGADVKLAGQDWIFEYRNPAGYIVIGQWLADEICVKADLRLSEVQATNYDAIFIPGGAWNPDMLRKDEEALRVIREARFNDVLLVSLCHGPQVFINAASAPNGQENLFPHGTHITGVENIWVDLENAGFTVHKNDPFVYDPERRLLTARNPHDLGILCEEMGRLLSPPMPR